MFGRHEMIVEPVLVYERGDTLADALKRIAAITPDPAAGRAERDPIHPTIEPVAEDLARPSRIMLSELIAAGLLALEVFDLADERSSMPRWTIPSRSSRSARLSL